MTVKYLKSLLDNFNDDDRVIIDNGQYEVADNEVVFVYKIAIKEEEKPIVILQTKKDVDIPEEIEAQMERFQEDNWSEQDAITLLFELGFVLDDFKYDEERYEWAKRCANEYGLI